MKSAFFRILMVLCFTLTGINANAQQSTLGLEYGSISLKAKGGQSVSLPAYRLSAFDTTGGLTAGIRGALNQNAAQKSKEYQIEQSVKNGNYQPENALGSYTYSWQQPAPTPTDGERWTLTTATDGVPVIDAISTPSANGGKKVNSMLGIEYSSSLWSFVSAPVSVSAGWGMKFFMGIGSSSASIPLDVTFSTQPMKDLGIYANLAVSPIGLASGKGYYFHQEVGAKWKFYDEAFLTLNYRNASDTLSDKDSENKPISYTQVSAYVGIGYGF